MSFLEFFQRQGSGKKIFLPFDRASSPLSNCILLIFYKTCVSQMAREERRISLKQFRTFHIFRNIDTRCWLLYFIYKHVSEREFFYHLIENFSFFRTVYNSFSLNIQKENDTWRKRSTSSTNLQFLYRFIK